MAETNTTDTDEIEIGSPLGWKEASEFFEEVNVFYYVIPVILFVCVMVLLYWWKWQKRKQYRQEQARANRTQGQNNQQNGSGSVGVLNRIFVFTTPLPVISQNEMAIRYSEPSTTSYSGPGQQHTTQYSQPSIDRFNYPSTSSYSVPGQTTQYSLPSMGSFDRPLPPPYPGIGKTTGM